MSWLLDRLTLRPTRHAIDGGQRHIDSLNEHPLELVVREANTHIGDSPGLLVCKFVGAGGRAENFSLHPFDRWDHLRGVVCAVNPPGFGQSGGRATLRSMFPAAQRAVAYVREQHPDTPLMLTGSSLGAAMAMQVAADLLDQGDRNRPGDPHRARVNRHHQNNTRYQVCAPHI